MNHLLVVSPDMEFRQKAYRSLQKEGFSVLMVPTPENIYTVLKNHSAELMIVDVLTRTSRGELLLQSLCRHKITLPLLGVCEKIDPALRKTAFDLGVYDLVEKNIPEEDLQARIQKVFEAQTKVIRPGFMESKGKVLVVDDELEIRQFLDDFLSAQGYQVRQASNGEECLELSKSWQPSTVFLDVIMPGMDGLLTLQNLKQENPGISVIMATGIQDIEIARQAVELGAEYYMLKPFDLKYLETVLLVRLAMAA